MALRGALTPFYTSKTKKKKKLPLLWKLRRLFWSGDVNKVRVTFYVMLMSSWRDCVFFCILTLVLVDGIRPGFLIIYHAPNESYRSQLSDTYVYVARLLLEDIIMTYCAIYIISNQNQLICSSNALLSSLLSSNFLFSLFFPQIQKFIVKDDLRAATYYPGNSNILISIYILII